jgi:hypothetical protein
MGRALKEEGTIKFCSLRAGCFAKSPIAKNIAKKD